MIDTPQTGEQLGRILDEVANSLYQDLARNCPEGDEAFKTRLHQCILMLQRFEKQMKKQKNGLKEEEDG